MYDLSILPQDVGSFFTWIGTASFFGLIMAYVLEGFKFWRNLAPETKRLWSIVVAIGLGGLSSALTKYVPAGVVASLDQVYKVVLSGIIVWVASQGTHKSGIDRLPDAPETPSPKTETGNMPKESLPRMGTVPVSDVKADG